MAVSVFYQPLDIALNLTEPSLGHPELPGLWERLRSDDREVPKRGLLCIECMYERPNCPEYMYLRELPDGRRQAVHHNPNIADHGPRTESPERRAVKERIAQAASSAGFQADLNAATDGGRRRSDVLIRGENRLLLGCEAQLSYVTAETVRKRSRVAEEDGVTPLWTTNDKKSPLIDQAPWTRIDDLPLELITSKRPLMVRGGVRALLMLPCNQRGLPCPDGRRGCDRSHGTWQVRHMPLDEVIVLAAARELVPLRMPGPRRTQIWIWVSPSDRETYLDSLPEPPAEQTRKRESETGQEAGPLDVHCRYRAPHEPQPTVIRDAGVAIDAPTLSLVKQPEPSSPKQVRPKDACSHWVAKEARYCGALPVRLYIPGRRCSAHTPAALAGEPEPGARPPDQE